MNFFNTTYSPDIQIFLHADGKCVRLADVLSNTATPYEPAQFVDNTPATIVFRIGDRERTESVIIKGDVTRESKRILFELTAEGATELDGVDLDDWR